MQQINLSNANSAIENIPNNCDMCASLKLNAERAWFVNFTPILYNMISNLLFFPQTNTAHLIVTGSTSNGCHN